MTHDPYAWRQERWDINGRVDQASVDEYRCLRLKTAEKVLLPLANCGERWAALRLIELCAETVRDNCRVSGKIGSWFAEGLLHIARGDTVEQGFSIPPRKKGEDKEGRAALDGERRFSLAYQAACLLLLDNEKQLYAFKKVGEANRVSDETVRKAWRDFRELAEREIRQQQEHLGKVFRI